MLSDEELMTLYAKGDLKAFESLYSKHKGPLYRYLLRQVTSQSSAEDLSQEVWGKVIRSASTYKTTAKFTTWLYTIARNKVIDKARHVKVVDKMIDNVVDNVVDNVNGTSQSTKENIEARGSDNAQPEQAYQLQRYASALELCINKLPKHQLDSFLLKEEAGFTAVAIANITDTNLEAIKSRLKTAYKNLRSCLDSRIDKQWQEGL